MFQTRIGVECQSMKIFCYMKQTRNSSLPVSQYVYATVQHSWEGDPVSGVSKLATNVNADLIFWDAT